MHPPHRLLAPQNNLLDAAKPPTEPYNFPRQHLREGRKGVMAPRAAVLLLAMAVASVFFASASAQGIMAPSSAPSSAPAPAPDTGAAAGLAPVSAVAVVASALVSLLAAMLLQ